MFLIINRKFGCKGKRKYWEKSFKGSLKKFLKIFLHIFQCQNILRLFLFKKQKLFWLRTGGCPPPPVYGPVRNLYIFFTPSLTGCAWIKLISIILYNSDLCTEQLISLRSLAADISCSVHKSEWHSFIHPEYPKKPGREV